MRPILAILLIAGCSGKKLCPGGQPACCHSSDDCDSASICFPPSGLGCVVQPVPPTVQSCHLDSDCADAGTALVCIQIACDSSRGKNCGTACTHDSDCGDGPICSSGHCLARPCSAGCPSLFTCDAASSTCKRLPCTRDADCPSGAVCVSNSCESSLGQCGLID